MRRDEDVYLKNYFGAKPSEKQAWRRKTTVKPTMKVLDKLKILS